MSLTPEQVKRIEANRQAAIQRRLQKEQEKTSQISPTTSPQQATNANTAPPNSPLKDFLSRQSQSNSNASPFFKTESSSNNFSSPQKISTTNTATSPYFHKDQTQPDSPLKTPTKGATQKSAPKSNIRSFFQPQPKELVLPIAPKNDKMEEGSMEIDELPGKNKRARHETEEEEIKHNISTITQDNKNSILKPRDLPDSKTIDKILDKIKKWEFDPDDPTSSRGHRMNIQPQTKPGTTFHGLAIKKETKIQSGERWQWLVDIRDESGKRPGEDGYDPQTLYIPKEAYENMTDVNKQYWSIKKHHFNRVIFFQQGAFYNVFERDADICHKELGWRYTHGEARGVNMYTAGISLDSYQDAMEKLVSLGYHVGKVDQVDPDDDGEDEDDGGNSKKGKKKSTQKFQQRKLDIFVTPGTALDGSFLSPETNYILSIKEYENGGNIRYGICLLDLSLGELVLGELSDDQQHSHMETLLILTKPKEIIYEQGKLNKELLSLFKQMPTVNSVLPLKSREDFWDSDTTWEFIAKNKFFSQKNEKWPDVLDKYQDNGLVMSALGGCISYLHKLNVSKNLNTVSSFREFNLYAQSSNVILDGQTLKNLEILQNNSDGTINGSLLKFMDHCVTPFGKRLFKQWLCHPLRSVERINERLDSVDQLRNTPELRATLSSYLKKLPDLERKIYHIYTKRGKLPDFLVVLDGFVVVTEMINQLQSQLQVSSSRLSKLLDFDHFPNIFEPLSLLRNSFGISEKMKKKGSNEIKVIKLIPKKGIKNFSVYESANQATLSIKKDIDKWLDQIRSKIGVSKISYKKKTYLIEILSKDAKNAKIPKSWKVEKELKSATRYRVPEFMEKVQLLLQAKSEKKAAQENTLSDLFETFNENYSSLWKRAVACVAELDCLLSLSITSSSGSMCRPQLVSSSSSFIKLNDVYHPCLQMRQGDCIPNDILLGGGKPPIILLTGPNMGGKSTILRTTCIATIMAQVGCYVPAEFCEISPVDRIFTRIGANDNIMRHQSTFMVELQETAQIIKYATPYSLVIMDELGRGTSTFDGYAIAYSVLKYFAEEVKSCMLFATHYHLLTKEFENNDSVTLYQMLIDESSQTTLYKIAEGACLKSYGMNVAKLVGIDDNIIRKASEMASLFESIAFYAIDRVSSSNGLKKVLPSDHKLNIIQLLRISRLSSDFPYIKLLDIWKSLQ